MLYQLSERSVLSDHLKLFHTGSNRSSAIKPSSIVLCVWLIALVALHFDIAPRFGAEVWWLGWANRVGLKCIQRSNHLTFELLAQDVGFSIFYMRFPRQNHVGKPVAVWPLWGSVVGGPVVLTQTEPGLRHKHKHGLLIQNNEGNNRLKSNLFQSMLPPKKHPKINSKVQKHLPSHCSLWLLTTAWLVLNWPLIGHTWTNPGWGRSFLNIPGAAVPHRASAAMWRVDQGSGPHYTDRGLY